MEFQAENTHQEMRIPAQGSHGNSQVRGFVGCPLPLSPVDSSSLYPLS